jgi:hypothetical protein
MTLWAPMFLAAALAGQDANPRVTGLVTDAAGQPLAGVRVDVATAAPRVGPGLFCPSCYLDCRRWTTTDEEGRFAIEVRDRSLCFRLLCTLPGRKPGLTELVDPEKGDIHVKLDALPANWPEAQIVRGRVLDDQDIPVEGALVEPSGAKTVERRWWGRVEVDSTVSDRHGRFALLLPAGYQGVDVEITADGFSGASVALLAPGPREHVVTVPAGTRVTGKLVRDGKPVALMRIAVVQVERSADHHFIKAVEATTDDAGSFVFDYLPADEPYVIYALIDGSNPPHVLSTKRFQAYGNRQTRDLGALKVMPALRLSGRVVLPEGDVLPADAKLVLSRNPAWDLVSTPLREDGTFEIGGLPPETYKVGLTVKGFVLDATRLDYQQVGSESFGIRIDQSIDDLRIPLTPSRDP